MIHGLKHYGTRLWATLLLGGLLCLWLSPGIQVLVGIDWLLLPVAILMALVFWAVGVGFNRLGVFMAQRQMGEAAVWERAGMVNEAEKAYRHALATLDSYLIRPTERGRRMGALTTRLAHFYSTGGSETLDAEAFIARHLYRHPDDRDMARGWLERMADLVEIDEPQQTLAEQIGEAQVEDDAIQVLIARLFLKAARTDFGALTVYRRVLSHPGSAAQQLAMELARLLLSAGRVDELALSVYLSALDQRPGDGELLKGIAACATWIQASDQNQALLAKARRAVAGIPEERLTAMRAGFHPPVRRFASAPPLEGRRPVSLHWPDLAALGRRVSTAAGRLRQQSGWMLQKLARTGSSRAFRKALKVGSIVVFGVAVLFLLVNTAEYLTQSRSTPVAEKTPQPPPVTDPFTIQVAAYSKGEDALRYVEQLRALGLDAYRTEATGAKRTWFQVRISHFADKAAAKQFGDGLKTKGVIDDYYVANYKPPIPEK